MWVRAVGNDWTLEGLLQAFRRNYNIRAEHLNAFTRPDSHLPVSDSLIHAIVSGFWIRNDKVGKPRASREQTVAPCLSLFLFLAFVVLLRTFKPIFNFTARRANEEVASLWPRRSIIQFLTMPVKGQNEIYQFCPFHNLQLCCEITIPKKTKHEIGDWRRRSRKGTVYICDMFLKSITSQHHISP